MNATTPTPAPADRLEEYLAYLARQPRPLMTLRVPLRSHVCSQPLTSRLRLVQVA